jgi:DNA-directed RNA polymerase specialized sigma54-like protein
LIKHFFKKEKTLIFPMLKQSLSQKMLQKLSPQQIQLMKLLQIPTATLDQRIKEELEANPALEEGEEADEVLEFGSSKEESLSAAVINCRPIIILRMRKTKPFPFLLKTRSMSISKSNSVC